MHLAAAGQILFLIFFFRCSTLSYQIRQQKRTLVDRIQTGSMVNRCFLIVNRPLFNWVSEVQTCGKGFKKSEESNLMGSCSGYR